MIELANFIGIPNADSLENNKAVYNAILNKIKDKNIKQEKENRSISPSQVIAIFSIFLTLSGLFLAWQANQIMELQNQLSEAERRNALIPLTSNVLDLVHDEVTKNKDDEEVRIRLSSGLINRVTNLSYAMKSYQYLNDGEADKVFSNPGRGYLLSTLMGYNLDSFTQSKIAKEGNFSRSFLRGLELSNAFLDNIKLIGVQLDRSKFYNVNMRGANLNWANLDQAELIDVDLTGAHLMNANLRDADLTGAILKNANLTGVDVNRAIGLTKNMIESCKSIYQIKNLHDSLKPQLQPIIDE